MSWHWELQQIPAVLAIAHLLSPMLLLKCLAGAVLLLSCSAGVTSLFFCPFFPALSPLKGEREETTLMSSMPHLFRPHSFPWSLIAQKGLHSTLLKKVKRSQTNMEAEGIEPWMFILGLTLTHKYICSASWKPLFPSVRDEIISTWRYAKVMSISSQQQNFREDLSKPTRPYHENLP